MHENRMSAQSGRCVKIILVGQVERSTDLSVWMYDSLDELRGLLRHGGGGHLAQRRPASGKRTLEHPQLRHSSESKTRHTPVAAVEPAKRATDYVHCDLVI